MKRATREVVIKNGDKQVRFIVSAEYGVIDMADKSEGFSGHWELFENTKVSVYVNGKKFEEKQLEDNRGCPRVKGLALPTGVVGRVGKVMLTEANFELIAAAQAEAIAEAATDAEYAELKAAEVAKKNSRELANAKHLIKKYESGKCLKSYEAATQYNNLYNEGGEGYVPEVITAEMYADAKAALEKATPAK